MEERAQAVVYAQGEGEPHLMGASEVVIKATGEDTGGAFVVTELQLQGGFAGPPRHYHQRLHETLYLLEGEIVLIVGQDETVLGPGGFASIPPGTVHTFRNDGDRPVRALNVNAPAGWEHYLREIAAAAQTSELTPALIVEIASRHDFHLA